MTHEPTPRNPPIALWQQLLWVERVMAQIDAGRGIATAMDLVPVYHRPGVQAIAYTVIRRYGLGQKLVSLLVARNPSAVTQRFLAIGLALLADPDGPPTQGDGMARYDSHTLVNQLVQAVAQAPKGTSQVGFVNGVMRQFLRQASTYLEQALQDSRARWNHPSWWLDRLKRDHPVHWKSILSASQYKAGMTLRVNQGHTTTEAYLALLIEQGFQAQRVGDSAIQLVKAVHVGQLPGFEQGWVSVQDAGAQMAAPLLINALPERVDVAKPLILDACAAPGGKTAHLLECLDCELVALEVDASRIDRVTENLVRLGLTAQVICADAGHVDAWQPQVGVDRLYDAILLDAPCSASGIVRRHPDIPWQRRETDIATLVQTQKKLLNALWPLLKPQGVLVYCTCSVFSAEGYDQIQRFLTTQPQAQLANPPLQLLPQKAENQVWQAGKLPTDHDGFFYAVLRKAAP